MMITVVLSSNMKRMMRDNVIVRKMVGIETSGSLNILFTDKTGTLTEGTLKVKAIYTADDGEYKSLGNLSRHEKYQKYITLCAGYCNNAIYDGKRAIGSDATDRALREMVHITLPEATVTYKEPFDSLKSICACRLSAWAKK